MKLEFDDWKSSFFLSSYHIKNILNIIETFKILYIFVYSLNFLYFICNFNNTNGRNQ